jgi:iron complex outermembrane receptor protein
MPLELKANLGINWNRGAWSAGWVGRFFDSYLVLNPAVASTANPAIIARQGNGGRVPSQNYHDIFAAYRLNEGGSALTSGILANAEIRVGIQNVFDTKPPIDTRSSLFYSTYGDPRLASYYITLKTAF